MSQRSLQHDNSEDTTTHYHTLVFSIQQPIISTVYTRDSPIHGYIVIANQWSADGSKVALAAPASSIPCCSNMLLCCEKLDDVTTPWRHHAVKADDGRRLALKRITPCHLLTGSNYVYRALRLSLCCCIRQLRWLNAWTKRSARHSGVVNNCRLTLMQATTSSWSVSSATLTTATSKAVRK